jgi:hypothetical protein
MGDTAPVPVSGSVKSSRIFAEEAHFLSVAKTARHNFFWERTQDQGFALSYGQMTAG